MFHALLKLFNKPPSFPSSPFRDDSHISGEYWEKIRADRETDDFYAANSWLLDHTESILNSNPRTVLEIGCGNGRFIREIAPRVDKAIGIDWAYAKALKNLPANSEFLKLDVLKDSLPSADVICSGDVLEHFKPDDIIPLVTKFSKAATKQYHVIACYDDTHSHLTVCHPDAWLQQFRKIDKRFSIVRQWTRRNNDQQIVCAIANY